MRDGEIEKKEEMVRWIDGNLERGRAADTGADGRYFYRISGRIA